MYSDRNVYACSVRAAPCVVTEVRARARKMKHFIFPKEMGPFRPEEIQQSGSISIAVVVST